MELVPGSVAVVTGGAGGIGFALAEAFARKGLNIVLADVQDDAMAEAVERLRRHDVEVLAVRTDVSDESSVLALAQATLDRFGAVHVVCNNAGVSGLGDSWFGPTSAWEWVIGVNLWGVIHGIRAFLPHLLTGGHIVNTASIAGVLPALAPPYDASKHAVVALTEHLYNDMVSAGVPVGVSVVCPGWVRTGLMDSERNWPDELGTQPAATPIQDLGRAHVRRALDEGMTPAAVADMVVGAVEGNRFWVFPHADFLELAVRRWERIAEGLDPEPPDQIPGLPPRSEMIAEVLAAMAATQRPEPQAVPDDTL